jgi:hypothetical protein
MPGRGTNEGMNAMSVAVRTGARPGRITVHMGITSDGPATESTQLAGRGGCAWRKWCNWIERTDDAKIRCHDLIREQAGRSGWWVEAAGKSIVTFNPSKQEAKGGSDKLRP